MARTPFVDANVLISAVDRAERHHATSLAVLASAELGEIPPLVTTDFVLCETLNFIHGRIGWDAARETLGRLEGSRGVEIHRVTDQIYTVTKNDVFPTLQGLSFVDASIVAFMKHHKMSTIYSLDSAFDRVPGIERRSSLP